MDRIVPPEERQFSGHSFDTTGSSSIAGMIINDETQWASFWEKHRPETVAPDIDFEKRFVVALFLGDRPTSGYAVDVVGLFFEAGTYELRYTTIRPGDECPVLQVVTQPHDIVAIDRVQQGLPDVETIRDQALVANC